VTFAVVDIFYAIVLLWSIGGIWLVFDWLDKNGPPDWMA
jgi:hypothetical protein